MAFLTGGAFNKSVFSKGSYAAAIGDGDTNGYAVVKITPKYARTGNKEADPPIKGVYDMASGELSFSIESSWESLGGIAQSVLPQGVGGIVDAYQKLGAVGNLLGATAQANVYASKKIYQKSNYMTISIPMMVVDWEGTGQPIFSAILLAWYCLPSGNVTKDITENVNRIIDDAKKAVAESSKVGEKIVKVTEEIQEGVEATKKVISTAIDQTGLPYAKDNATGDLDDLITLRSSPVPVKVEIGQFFKHEDMVIENLQYTFSKEMTKAGPLYVKFNISLSTRKILGSIEDIGLAVRKNQRYFELI